MRTVSIDIETYSSTNLAKSGVYRYCESPDFEILLFGYSVDGGDAHVISLADGENIPINILNAVTDDTVQKWAFNANFERVCLSRWLKQPLSPNLWRCTMGMVSIHGITAVTGESRSCTRT